jgi:hypothetical protein
MNTKLENELTSGRRYWLEQVTRALENISLEDLNRAEKEFKQNLHAKFELTIEQNGYATNATMGVHWPKSGEKIE